MNNFIANLPKAELHLHIEGTLTPELMFKLAKRNNVKLPYTSVEEIQKVYSFNCLQDFLDIYYQGASVLLEEIDFYDLTYSYLEKCKEENILHLEIMFDPQTHTQRGVSFDKVINGISNACRDAEAKLGISSLIIMSYLRHLSEESAEETLEMSLPYKEKITAVGIDSTEKNNPPSKFKNVYQKSIEAGYLPTAHAGEEGSPKYIWEAIDILKVQRIDHGNSIVEDEKLIEEVKKRDFVLTMCPLSNIALKVIDCIKKHPLKTLMEKGVKVTINSDDPAYFGGYLNENYNSIQKALNLSNKDLYHFAKNSFQYSFLPQEKKDMFIKKVDEYYNTNS